MNKIYDSSMFEAIIEDGTLIVRFKSNKTIYIYSELSDDILEWFKSAESKGKYFIANIQKTAIFKKTDFITFDEALESIK